ncbi:twin-arginine translocase TatA/TatE family subunit [Microbacterium testaceum]|uniref:Sec-independent protein translocase subunit TatA/TatB n=1 Tax=Microbacterium testaceum TaxID=2033 RepID=UPI001243CE2D|nr:hypothetical protein [Microbacterium testaceum]
MFGLTFEKLLLVGLVAAVVIGPQRLPGAVARLTSVLRGLRRTVDAARLRAASELGVPAAASEWRALDPRRYDPRRIIAEALGAPSAGAAASGAESPVTGEAPSPSTDAGDTGPVDAPRQSMPMRRVRAGSSAHPRWIEVPHAPATTEREPEDVAAPADEPTTRAAQAAVSA